MPFFDPLYIVVLVVTLGITGWAAWRVRSTYSKWSKVDSGINMDAFDFARRLLDRSFIDIIQDLAPDAFDQIEKLAGTVQGASQE